MPLAPPMTPQPTGYSGPSAPPSQNPGLQAQAMTMVREAVQLLQKALVGLPMGSDEHGDVLQTITKLSKMAPPSAAIPGLQSTTLQGLQQDADRSGAMQALMRQMAAAKAGGPGGAPGGPPGAGAPPGGGQPPMMAS